jgi:putative SOS response-associated peptidase YedK
MCGKFTAMASWRDVVDFSEPLTTDGGPEDRVVTYRPMAMVPVIVFDHETGTRHVVPMRWGFPHPKNFRIPQPIHARAESIDTTRAFCDAFAAGQRGIVVMQTFNEGKELSPTKTEQWTINPGDGVPRGFAFLWRRFEVADLPAPMLACVMVTVQANKLIRDAIMEGVADPRMPAILEDADWSTWLGETDAASDQIKATLRTLEGVNWRIYPEPKPQRDKPTKQTKPADKPPAEPSLF